MKKIYIFLPSAALFIYLFPGMSQPVFAQNGYLMNAALAEGQFLGSYVAGPYPVFPDSTVLFTFSNGNYNTFVHLCGNVLDPIAPNMISYAGNSSWTTNTPYTVDSMSIGYVYNRSTAANIIDTMVVYLYNDSNPADLPIRYVVDTLGDTLFYKQMLYDYPKNQPKVSNPASLKTFKIPLTINDTGVVDNTKYFSTNHFSVPAGKRAVSAFGFIPGYTYPPGALITGAYNEWDIIYFDLNAFKSYPVYFGTDDWNLSEIITTAEFYNEPGNPWNGFFFPPYASVLTYALEELDVYYKVSEVAVGLNENGSKGGIKLYQNQPNPSNNTTLIRYELSKSAPVTIEVRDLMGRPVLSITDENQSTGKHSAVLNTSNLSKGMYLYTLTAGKESITRRMIVE